MKHRFTRRFIKTLYAVSFNIFLAVEADGLFNQVFYRQTVAIPPPLPAHKSSAHRLIARDCVFYHTSEEMTVMRQARCERRTVVKYKRLSVFCLFQSFFKNMIFLPEFQYLLFLLRCRPPFRLLAVIFFHNMNIISLYAPQKKLGVPHQNTTYQMPVPTLQYSQYQIFHLPICLVPGSYTILYYFIRPWCGGQTIHTKLA